MKEKTKNIAPPIALASIELPMNFTVLETLKPESKLWKKLKRIGNNLKELDVKLIIRGDYVDIRHPRDLTEKEANLINRYIARYRSVVDVITGKMAAERRARLTKHSKERKEETKKIIRECAKEMRNGQKVDAIFKSVARRHKLGIREKPISWQTVKRMWYSRKKFVKR